MANTFLESEYVKSIGEQIKNANDKLDKLSAIDNHMTPKEIEEHLRSVSYWSGKISGLRAALELYFIFQSEIKDENV